MGFKHIFKAKLNWAFSSKVEELNTKIYRKSHSVTIDGKTVLNMSAAKIFKGDPALYNPEDLLLSSVVSCHMMSYLFVCEKNGIEIIAYSDESEATLELLANGSGRFIGIKLHPKVMIRNEEQIEQALKLHKKANQLCFIANSCNFPIEHFPICESASKS